MYGLIMLASDLAALAVATLSILWGRYASMKSVARTMLGIGPILVLFAGYHIVTAPNSNGVFGFLAIFIAGVSFVYTGWESLQIHKLDDRMNNYYDDRDHL